jgi:ATP-dependent Clp protease ATP-binding subunit ClpC
MAPHARRPRLFPSHCAAAATLDDRRTINGSINPRKSARIGLPNLIAHTKRKSDDQTSRPRHAVAGAAGGCWHPTRRQRAIGASSRGPVAYTGGTTLVLRTACSMTAAATYTFSDHAHSALNAAERARLRLEHVALEPEHLLAGLLDVPEGNAVLILRHLRLNTDELRRELDLFLRRTVPIPSGDTLALDGRDVPLGVTGGAVVRRAAALAGDAPAGTEHLLRALQTLPSPAATLLRTFGATPEEVDRRFVPESEAARREGPVVDLVARARLGLLPPLVERPALLRELSVRLLGAGRRAVLLVGEPGVGKHSLVLLLARAIAALESGATNAGYPPPDTGLPTRLVRAGDMALLTNPAQALREAARPTAVASVPYSHGGEGSMPPSVLGAPSSILWVPDIHMYLGGSNRPADIEAGLVLRELIAEGRVRVIGGTTPDAQRRFLSADAGLFEPMTVSEPSADEVAAIVAAAAPGLAAAHGVTIGADALDAAAALARRYGGYTGVALPGSALRVLERACVEVRLAGAAGLGFSPDVSDRVVDAPDVAVAVSAMTGISVQQVGEAEAQRLAAMEEHLRRRVIGQDEALNALARAVRRARMGFKDPKRPVGSFLFLGGSGVGKTESARALAEFLFGGEDQMIRLDMSEYTDKHTVARMIGAPPGYVGYDEGGQLTEAVRRRPESLVLFDEVEKAHPDVLTIMLQILEDGRLTDGKGRTVDFRQTVIIMTSNVGTHLLRTVQGPIEGEVKDLLENELRRYFRVEFLNRLDKIIYFRFLAPDDLARILDLMLNKAAERARAAGVSLDVTPAARAWLLAQNHEPEFGARPLRRIVQDHIEDALVERLLRGEVHAGQTVRVDAGGAGLRFETRTPEAAA